MKIIFIIGVLFGIGVVMVWYFQVKGWNVIVIMWNFVSGLDLNKLENVYLIWLDVMDVVLIVMVVVEGIECFGQIDVLLNNVGYGVYGVFEVFFMDCIRCQFDINVIGLMEVIKVVFFYFC